jgi:hypothetical protein
MATLTPVSGWDSVYQFETADLLQGGAGGIDNDPNQNLTNRTEYIYDTFYAAGTPLVTPVDLQIAGDTDANLMYVDVSLDLVGIGKQPAATEKLDVTTSTTNRAIRGVNTGTSGSFSGVYGWTSGTTGAGVLGTASATGAYENYGGFFDAAGDSGIGCRGEAIATGAVTNYGLIGSAAGDTGQGVYGEGSAAGAVTNYGGYFTAAGNSGRGVYATAPAYGGYFESANIGVYVEGVNQGGEFLSTGASGRGIVVGVDHTTGSNLAGHFYTSSSAGIGVLAECNSSGAVTAFGLKAECESTAATSAAVRGDGNGANSHDFLALNNEYDAVSMKSQKVNKQDVDIPDMIRNYPGFHIQKYTYKFNDKFRELITPYADEFQEAFELTEAIDNENINNACVAGVAFGGVVQLIKELDALKTRVQILEGV